jgi:hypothetical protein
LPGLPNGITIWRLSVNHSPQNYRPTSPDMPFKELSGALTDEVAAAKRIPAAGTAPELQDVSRNPSSPETAVLYRWIRLPKHCALTGDTPYSVHARRRKGVWQDGVQCQLGPDGNLYVNPVEWNKWVEGSNTPSSVRAA